LALRAHRDRRLGVVLVTGLHVNVPVTMIVLVALSMFVEWRLRSAAKPA